MGISSLSMFEQVTLGPYEEKIRRLLFAENPGFSHHFPCFLTGILFNGSFPDWIVAPDLVVENGRHCYRFLLSGVLYSFFVTRKRFTFDAEEFAINKDGTFVLRIEELSNVPFLRELVMQHSRLLNNSRP
jgi:hypothetical protein